MKQAPWNSQIGKYEEQPWGEGKRVIYD